MRTHMLVFIQEFGPVIGQYPIEAGIDGRKDPRMLERWRLANANPSCIAAFWYDGGELFQFQFNRA